MIRPVRRTSSGKRGNAILTRLLTLKVAWSISVPTSKVIVIVSVPLESALELKYRRFSTPLSCSSIGAATVFSQCFGTRAGIGCGYKDGGGRDLWILCDGQLHRCSQPG